MKSHPRLEFRALFEDERDRLYRFLYRLTGNPADAEDLLQETFLAVWRKREQFEGRGTAAGWLRRTAWNLFLNAKLRRDRRSGLAPRPEPGELHQEPDTSFERDEARGMILAQVRAEVDRLSEPARQAFLMFRYEGMTCAEIARLFGAPVKTIESRVARATQQIARSLRAHRRPMESP